MKKLIQVGDIRLGEIEDCEDTNYTFVLDHIDGTRESFKLTGYSAVQNALTQHYFSKHRMTANIYLTKGWLK